MLRVIKNAFINFKKNIVALLFFCAVIFGSIGEANAQTNSEPRTNGENSASVELGRRISFQSKRLGEARSALIYVPASAANSKRKYPVIYVLDGEYNFLQAVSTASFLARNGLMPESIIVGVGNVDRNRDFTPKLIKTSAPPPGMDSSGKADDFLAYLGDELIPYVDRNYPTEPFKILVGHSLGGLFADYSLITRPELFRGYVTLEPSLWWDDRSMVERVDKFFRANPQFAGRMMMAEGTSVEGWRDDWAKVKQLSPKNMRWSLIDVPNETHETMFFQGLYDSLRKMFEDYLPQMRNDESKANLAALEKQYGIDLSKDYGYAMQIPEFALAEAARRAADRKDFTSAAQLLEKTVSLYPSDRNRQMFAEAQQKAAANPAKAASDSQAELTSAKDGAAFVGSWEGILKTEPGMPGQIIITFEVVDGYLVGHGIAKGIAMNGGDLRTEVSGIRIKGNSIEWNRSDRNGGTHVHIGQLKDADTLEGYVELRGAAPPPPGFKLPKVTFLLKRQKN